MATIHKHPVYDTDLHLLIDPITREITNESGKTVIMQYDHNSERFTFEIPRYVDGHDMSLCNIVEFHYINTDANDKTLQNADVYQVDDLMTSEDDSAVIGSWLVSKNATELNGTLFFIVRFACVDVDSGEVTYQWFSNICTVLKVNKGMYNIDIVTQEGNSDVLESWRKTILDDINPYLEIFDRKLSSTKLTVNSETGELEYVSDVFSFSLNEATGCLEWEVIQNG